MAGFRSTKFDPILILFQIIALQSVFYASQSLFTALYSYFPNAYPETIDSIFSIQIRKDIVVIQLLGILVTSCSTLFLIVRTKSILDSLITLHFIHFIIVILFNSSFPTQFSWWALQICSAAIGTLTGEWLCMKEETKEIKLRLPLASKKESSEA
ncbi:Protein SYS1 homolog [Strongyloides ratti]|uniref:Protein SYS1 homolog n=1 Tax=Strongyloides ratti TaxID=34506 RepID=A0A090MYU2_STRRB|nr:Protein SYS1 homolog [Strongyloides ratti]CEF67779.1 Protein SYS1 homolog [Strongyloides ratti]